MRHAELPIDLTEILAQVADGTLSPDEAEFLIRQEFVPGRQSETPLFVPLLFLGIGFLLSVIAAVAGVRSREFVRSSLETEGTVVKIVSGNSPLVRYQVGDEVFEVQSSISRSPVGYSVGDKVTVLYYPQQPEKGEIKSFADQWLISSISGGLGAVFVAVGIGVLWIWARDKLTDARPEQPLAEEGVS